MESLTCGKAVSYTHLDVYKRQEFYHIFRDLRTMLILLGMPVVQIILFGFAITTVGNVVSGSARAKETLEWLSSDIFGRT